MITHPLTAEERQMWGEMRMPATDVADVTRVPPTPYLANGRGPKEGLEFLFRPGERVRLRIIKRIGDERFFNIGIPGLPMTVIAADGQNVRPVEVDEFQIGTAETYDGDLTPGTTDAYAIIAECMDRSGMALAMLASRPGARAPVPALRKPPLLDMGDMGMNHGDMGDEGRCTAWPA